MPDDMDKLVRDAGELTGAALPALLDDAAPTLRLGPPDSPGQDGFYLVGLIGGKEVGKTALVNALVGQTLSPSTSYGPGTESVIAYVHRDRAAVVGELLEREVSERYRIVEHAAPHLLDQVLLDLPDIDSLYTEHLEITRRMLRHMLFPVWIQSVEKYADRQPLRLLAKVAEGNDPANFVFCLNKIDQVEQREAAGAAGVLREDFAGRIAAALSLPAPPRVHLISAIQPQAHDLPELRQMLSRQKPAQDVQQSVQLATRQRQRTMLRWLDGLDLPAQAERLQRLQTEAEELAAARLAGPLLERALPDLLDDPAYRLGLIDQVMTHRVARWPIVNLVHMLLTPLTSLWRRNATSASGPAVDSLVRAYVDAQRPLSSVVMSTFAQLHQSHPAVSPLYQRRKLWDQMEADRAAADLCGELSAALDRQRTIVTTRLAGRSGVVAPLVRIVLTIGAVLWFPLVQPALEAVLVNGIQKSWSVAALDLGLLAVKIASAAYMLQAAAFLAIWFTLLWLILRWRTHRQIARLLDRWRTVDAGDATESPAAVVIAWMDGLLDPIRTARRRMDELVRRTEELRQSLARSAA
jgi:hypothetical protein